MFQDPAVIEEDLLHCYPDEYFTHDAELAESLERNCQIDSIRRRLRGVILHFADHGPDGEPSKLLRAAGWFLAKIPHYRLLARYGLPDSLGTSHRKTGKCLEIGPGRGEDLRRLRQIGWDAVGLDIDPVAAEVARRNSGCDVHAGSIAAAPFEAGQFDLIYMNHVAEHLPDIREALAHCFRWLSDGGRLVLVYPNPQSLVNTVCGPFSPNWDAPRHLVLPPRRAIVPLLEQLGFSKVAATTSARRASMLRQIGRHYREGNRGWTGLGSPRLTDRFVAAVEKAVVTVGFPMGEELLVTAHK